MSLSRAAASASLNRSCSLTISPSSPRARSRETSTGGSIRVAITRCDTTGRCSSRKRTPSWTAGSRDQVVVVEHEDVLLLGVHQRVDEHRQRGVADEVPGAATAASKAGGTSTPALRSAAAT